MGTGFTWNTQDREGDIAAAEKNLGGGRTYAQRRKLSPSGAG